MLKTRQRRPGFVLLPKYDDLKSESIRAVVCNEVSKLRQRNYAKYSVFFIRLALRLKFISRTKMAATGLGSDAEWRNDVVGQEARERSAGEEKGGPLHWAARSLLKNRNFSFKVQTIAI